MRKTLENRISFSSDSDEELELNICKVNESGSLSDSDRSLDMDGCEIDTWNEVDNLESVAIIQNSDSDSGSDSDSSSEMNDLISGLRTWTVDCNINHSQLNKLLPLLKKSTKFADLPMCAKTLLCTSHEVDCRSVSGGDYVFFGIKAGLECVFKSKLDVLSQLSVIELVFNIDGLPLFASSSYSFWPILCYCTAIPTKVFVVSLYGGKSKPNSLNFIDDMVQELTRLMQDGVCIYDITLPCFPKMCICDAPARAMVKCVKLYSGYYGCDKCEQKGLYIGRMTYPECEPICRTGESFRAKHNTEHHNGDSPFLALPVDMVRFFPIDYMHQVCLGVVKRLIVCWTSGPLSVRLSASQKASVNERLSTFSGIVTNDFCRRPRRLSDIAYWKATELRMFLLYSGYFVLHGILRDELLNHFMCLSVAIGIFVSPKLSCNGQYLNFAHRLLLYFVDRSCELYGKEFLVYNVHSLVHLKSEVESFGKLDNSSAFVFENFMQQLKKLVRSAKNPLIQVARRLKEQNMFSSLTLNAIPESSFLGDYSCSAPNSFCVLDDGRCCEVISNGGEIVVCIIYSVSSPLFTNPCDSRIIGVYKTRRRDGKMKSLARDTIVYKAMCHRMFDRDYIVFIKLLHHV